LHAVSDQWGRILIGANESEESTRTENVAYRMGTGDWKAIKDANQSLEVLLAEAARWGEVLEGIERPWLCWNVDPQWCLVQQRLVRSVGWTPVVGFDPRVGPPPLTPGAVLMDFNEKYRFPTMWMHFPLEFIFQFCNRLAYWHSDCLIRAEKMRRYAELFASLRDGEMAAVRPRESWHNWLSPRERRYWELLGCSTRGASRNQFERACGWWMNFHSHPNTPEAHRAYRQKYHWECGVGIWHWNKKCGGVVHGIPIAQIREGHFTGIGRKDYKRVSPHNALRDMSKELSLNNDLREACDKIGIGHFLVSGP
jgi:hypothetical protein